MGYYIKTEEETGEHHGKSKFIVEKYAGRIVTEAEACQVVDSEGVIVVCDNGMFEAAGFAFDQGEFNAFTNPDDARRKTFVVIDREKAKELTNYPR